MHNYHGGHPPPLPLHPAAPGYGPQDGPMLRAVPANRSHPECVYERERERVCVCMSE